METVTGGRRRAGVRANLNRALVFGDRFGLTALVTNKTNWVGNIAYEIPLNYVNTRAQFSYSHTNYELAKEFANLGVNGKADTLGFGLSHPFINRDDLLFKLSLEPRFKFLKDEVAQVSSVERKRVPLVPLSAFVMVRDSFLGGGVTWAELAIMRGHLSIRTEAARERDSETARAQGFFNMVQANITRIQKLAEPLRLKIHARGQWSNKNLGSSERFILGGPGGVRAYHTSEGSGDEGYLGQAELRYLAHQYASVFVFYDGGRVRINKKPWEAGQNHQTLKGGGLGVTVDWKGLDLNLMAANHKFKTKDGVVWFSGNFNF